MSVDLITLHTSKTDFHSVMLLKNDEKRIETQRSGGKKRSSLQNKWFGCEVMHAGIH